MTTVKIYRNRRCENKYIELHDDGHRHHSLRQFMFWPASDRIPRPVKNLLGDRCLHRWRKGNLAELLEDYKEVNPEEKVYEMLLPQARG